ncbi:glycosyltransferase family 2 protein [Geobacillus stearothermophilus]|nr:glycosyltransferase family 2 protein [Geobacillus stearothermophilus]
MKSQRQVAAVVVTYNRKNLLIECLESLLNQTFPIDLIIVIDNASTDGTQVYLREKGLLDNPKISYIRLEINIGGAGGFYEGLKIGYRENFEWLWIMDDDTIPSSNALEELMNANELLKKEDVNPLILGSRVNWIDGDPHPMNFPQIKRRNWNQIFLGLEYGLLPLRSVSFVSVLINSYAIEKYGFPMKKYFIWNDDVEYTGRILKEENGFLVPKSVVTHKTVTKYSPIEASADRFFFEVRNKIWMILKSDAWTSYEKIRYSAILTKNIINFLLRNKFSFKSVSVVLRGLVQGFIKSPY